MPQYKLMYFNLQGRAELSRVIFAYAGEKYEDIRYEFPEFPAIKPSKRAHLNHLCHALTRWCSIVSFAALPFLQLPVLEIDGVRLTQSHTIARYLARKFNIAGKNDLEAAQADAYIDLIYDILDGEWQIGTFSDEMTNALRPADINMKYFSRQTGALWNRSRKEERADGESGGRENHSYIGHCGETAES